MRERQEGGSVCFAGDRRGNNAPVCLSVRCERGQKISVIFSLV